MDGFVSSPVVYDLARARSVWGIFYQYYAAIILSMEVISNLSVVARFFKWDFRKSLKLTYIVRKGNLSVIVLMSYYKK